MNYILVSTRFGWSVLVGSRAGLYSLTMPKPSPEMALDDVGRAIEGAVEDDRVFGDLPGRLKRYFNGERVVFNDRLDLSGTTAFQQAVWKATRTIPCGETRSYGWVAGRIDNPRACRAVGNALGRNRLPIVVPCHRVIAGDGSLGGFGNDLPLKKRLIELEANR
ncbi:MAG: methylated-DNA--[protein]-cysteine S-methyltransferase [Chloroflexi bacterium]|nr:methylated-DNA--[protein]-cysteine S-methyltransferase [Chloroflexota bacterium]